MNNKLRIILLTIILIHLKVSAQITLGSSNMPQFGDLYIRATDLAPSVIPGNSGANQVWDFSSLNADQSDTEQFINPGLAPFFVDFPTATISEKVSNGAAGSGYSFWEINSDSLIRIGFIGSNLSETAYTPGVFILPIPCNYLTTWGGVSNSAVKYASPIYSGYDSLMHRYVQVYHDTIDAWGDLTTPLGTFSALRGFEISWFTDSIWRHSISTQSWSYYQCSVYSLKDYFWRSNGIHERNVRMFVDSLNNPISVTWIQSIQPNEIQEVEGNSCKLYPNPAINEIIFEFEFQKTKTIKIYDAYGKEIKVIEVTSDIVNLNTSKFPDGVYFYDLTNSFAEIIERGKFVIHH